MWLRLVLAAVVTVTLASAQRGGGMGGDEGGGMGGGDGMGGGGRTGGGMGAGGGMGGGGGMMMRRPQSKTDQIIDKLKLNKDQKEEFQNILSAGREEAEPLREKLEAARVQYANCIIQAKPEADVKSALQAYTNASAEMTALEVKAFTKLYASLKPNQQSKAAQAFALMAGIFDPAMGGRGMGMAGRGR
jgi:hypothetical protein